MKLSIIIPVLNSHEIVRRQVLHYDKMNLPEDVEVIFIDDGSSPPLVDALMKDAVEPNFYGFPCDFYLSVYETNDTRMWTHPKARNFGASKAKGETLLFTDIDHIIDRKAVDFGREFKYDYGRFYRDLGVLNEDGNFTQDPEVLMEWGLSEEKARGDLHIGCHIMSMYVKADVFNRIGGFRERLINYPTHDDGNMKGKLNRAKLNKCPDDERPNIYMFPNGRYCGDKNYNPFNLFHTLKR